MSRSALAFLLACLGISTAPAQSFPTKPLKLIVPFTAGATPDVVARVVAQGLSTGLGQPVVVENRPGAAGTTGAEAGAKSSPDGYTLTLGTTGNLASAPGLFPALGYDPAKSFDPIGLLASSPMVVAAHPSAGSTLAELIALAKSKPGALNYASFGSGGGPHIAAEMLKSRAGIDLTHVPYKVMANAVADLVSGRIHVMVNQQTQFRAHVPTGKLRILAIAGPKRLAQLPDVPTTAEAGLRGFEVSTWFALLAPAGTPKDVLGRLNAELRRTLETKEVLENLRAQGFEPAIASPEKLADFIVEETAVWSKAIRDSGAKLE